MDLLQMLKNLELLRSYLLDRKKILSEEEKTIVLEILINLLPEQYKDLTQEEKIGVLKTLIDDLPEVDCYNKKEIKCPYAILCSDESISEIKVLCRALKSTSYSYSNNGIVSNKHCPMKKLGSKIEKII